MNGPELLAVAGGLLAVALIGAPMALRTRRPQPASAEAAAMSRPYRYRGPDGQVHELAYDALPTALGRWTYQTQSEPSFAFAFDLERHGDVVRIYIAEAPSYAGRDEGLCVTHRLSDGARRYICIGSASPPVDGREAATWLIYWAEGTAQYILTGRAFR